MIIWFDNGEGKLVKKSLAAYMSVIDKDTGAPIVANPSCGADYHAIFTEKAVNECGDTVILIRQWNPEKGDLTVADRAGRAVLASSISSDDEPQDVCDRLMIHDVVQAAEMIKLITRMSAMLGWNLGEVQ